MLSIIFLINGVICGIILLQTFVVAPSVFKSLGEKHAGPFLRSLFPKFFIFIIISPNLMLILQKIKDLWVQYLIIIFPNQNISDQDHIKFGKKFGELEVHPSLSHRSSKNPEIYRVSNVDENGKIIPNQETSWQYLKQSWLWHTDSSFRKIPSNGSILHGISTTNKGGNTLFANMYKAYDDLDEILKEKIRNLRVCLLYTSPSPRDRTRSRMPSSA